jgi:hypothetical protein
VETVPTELCLESLKNDHKLQSSPRQRMSAARGCIHSTIRLCVQVEMVQSKRPIDNEMPTALKRRKVRRGTQNCWECRRRKIRCTYAVPTDSVCDGCKSRRLRCISQIFSEVTAEGTEAIAQAENLRRSTTEEEVLTRESAPTGLRSLKPRTRRPIQPNTTPVQVCDSTYARYFGVLTYRPLKGFSGRPRAVAVGGPR